MDTNAWHKYLQPSIATLQLAHRLSCGPFSPVLYNRYPFRFFYRRRLDPFAKEACIPIHAIPNVNERSLKKGIIAMKVT